MVMVTVGVKIVQTIVGGVSDRTHQIPRRKHAVLDQCDSWRNVLLKSPQKKPDIARPRKKTHRRSVINETALCYRITAREPVLAILVMRMYLKGAILKDQKNLTGVSLRLWISKQDVISNQETTEERGIILVKINQQ